mgnify:CR=1 FL=1
MEDHENLVEKYRISKYLDIIGQEKAVEELKDECMELWQEAQEFTLIFSKIAVNTN